MKTRNTLALFLFFLFFSLNAQDFESYVLKGDSCFNNRKLSQSVVYYKKALNLKPERLLTKPNEVEIFSKLSNVYFELAEYNVALEYLFKYLETQYVTQNDTLLPLVYNRIGRCYGHLNQGEQALKFYKKTKETAGADNRTLATAYNNIADEYVKAKRYDLAKEYFTKALLLFEKVGAYDGVIVANINLGDIEQINKKIETAQHYFTNAEAIAIEKKDTFYLVVARIYLAGFYIKITDYNKAEEMLEWALQTSKKKNIPQYVNKSYEGFVKLYKTKKDFKKAYEYLEIYKANSDSIFNLNSTRAYAELEAKFSIQEKEKENEILKKEQYFTETQIALQSKYIWVLSVLVILAVLFMGLFYLQRVKGSKAKKLLEEQNKVIGKSKKQLEDLNRQYEKLIEKYEGGDSNKESNIKLS